MFSGVLTNKKENVKKITKKTVKKYNKSFLPKKAPKIWIAYQEAKEVQINRKKCVNNTKENGSRSISFHFS